MKRHIDGIDGLRAIAVVAVLAFHAFPSIVPGGYIGVDMFFVISGFIITKIYFDKLAEKRVSFSEFYLKRVRRLAPVYLLVILVSTIAAYFVLDPPLLKNYSSSLAAQVLYLQNFTFWSQGDYFAVPLTKPLLHTWSLAIEEQFYLAYAIPVLIARWWPKAAITCVVALIALSYGTGDILAVVSPKTNFFLLPARLWEFGFGFMIARTFPAISSALKKPFLFAGLAMILVGIFAFDESSLFPGPQSLLVCLGTALALWTYAAEGRESDFLGSMPMRYVGRLSYSLYLWHWPIIALGATYVGHSLGPITAAGALVLSWLLAHLSHKFVEQPFRTGTFVSSNQKLLTLVGTGCALVVSIACLFYFTQGATFRYSRAVANLYVAEQVKSPYRCSYWKRITGFPSEMCSVASVQSAESGSALIIGDSHADQLDEMIGATGKANGFNVFLTTRNCTLDSFGSTSFCSLSVLKNIAKEIQQKKIRYVFAISYVGQDIDKSAVNRSVQYLLNSGLKRLFIMDTVPNGPYFSPSTRIDDLAKGVKPDSNYSLNTYIFSTSISRTLYKSIAASDERVTVLDPGFLICPGGRCMFEWNGKPLYFDSNHLSPTGASILRPLYETTFENLTVSY